LHQDHGIGRAQRLRELEHLYLVDEEAHVRAHPVLLVDHAEAQAGGYRRSRSADNW
jgi:hypothetical protein